MVSDQVNSRRNILAFLNRIIFGCAGSSLLYKGFLSLQQAGATVDCCALASHCGGFSLEQGSRVRGLGRRSSWALEHWPSSCGARV